MDKLINNLFYEAEHYFFEAINSYSCEFDSHCTAYRTEVYDAALNILFIRKHVSSLGALLAKAATFFKAVKLPWSIEIPMDLCSEAWVDILAQNGFSKTETAVAMAIPLAMKEQAYQQNFDIRDMNDALDQWMEPLIAYPSTTAEINEQYKERHVKALQRGKTLLHFSLFERDQVISSLTLSLNQGSARIDDVATIPEFQGQGYASKLMKFALHKAAKMGANHCFLEASQQGLSIYKKLNFQILFYNQIFSRSATSYEE